MIIMLGLFGEEYTRVGKTEENVENIWMRSKNRSVEGALTSTQF